VRERAGFEVMNLGAPIDVLWMRISKQPGDPAQSLGRMNYGRFLVMLDRGDYWQCAYLIRKGEFATLQSRGIEFLREQIGRIAPFSRQRLGELKTMDDVKLLTVVVDRLKKWWRPGWLCIGDSAHAMSPAGGIGINLAIQDAVAAANILAEPLRSGSLTDAHLRQVEERRTPPTQRTQNLQIQIHKRVFERNIGIERPMTAPWLVILLDRIPWLRRIPARIIGVGFQPEHVQTRAVGV
jgi:2-polyprenyl-6-methoxyphenol hydroxylase-like FAD-dependent oxidoreductase